MTSIFDGVAGTLNDVFGAPVTIWDDTGVARTVQARFRYEPTEVFGADDAPSLVEQPVLYVPKTLADGIARGTAVEIASGERFLVVNRQRSQASPASDATLRFHLEPESFVE